MNPSQSKHNDLLSQSKHNEYVHNSKILKQMGGLTISDIINSDCQQNQKPNVDQSQEIIDQFVEDETNNNIESDDGYDVASISSSDDADEEISKILTSRELFDEKLNYDNQNKNLSDASITYPKHQIMSDLHLKSKITQIIDDYIKNPLGTLVFENVKMTELPDILKTFDSVEHLKIIQCGLLSLNNLPPSLKTLDVKCNNLKSLKSDCLPLSLIEINASKNQIEELDIGDLINLKTINIANNPLKNVISMSKNIEMLNVTGSCFDNSKILQTLTKLVVFRGNGCKINTLDLFSDSVEDIAVSKLTIFGGSDLSIQGRVSKLPANIQKLKCHNCNMKDFGFEVFPQSLIHLDLYDNQITKLPRLPKSMDYVDISKNNLKHIVFVPDVVQQFDCSDNPELIFTSQQHTHIETLKSYGCNFIDDSDSEFWLNMMDSSSTDAIDIFPDDHDSSAPRSANPRVIMSPPHSKLSEKTDTTKFSHIPFRSGIIIGNKQEPKYPEHVAKRMGSDGFFPSKDRSRMIKHKFVYTV